MSFNITTNQSFIACRTFTSMSEKILENVHDQLYNNLYLLTKFYAAPKKMAALLERDMFVKNNKAASHEVIHYLLTIADPQLVQDTITTWPPYDVKRETKFRSEVLRCLEAIKSKYDAELPSIMASHLISPGGFKFASFIYKLSQFVIYQHLKKTETENILRCPKKDKRANMTSFKLNNLKHLSQSIECEMSNCLQSQEKYHEDTKIMSKKIMEERRTLEKQISAFTEKYKESKAEFDKQYPSYPSVTHLMESLQSLKTDWENMNKIHSLFQESHTMMSYLTSSDLVLEHNKDIQRDCMKRNELDLIEYFKSLSSICEKSAFELPNPTKTFLMGVEANLSILFEKMARLDEGLESNKKEFQIALEEAGKLFTGLLTADADVKRMDSINSVESPHL